MGFIGYPIVSSIFGPQAIFYAALLNMPNTFFIFTAGVMLIKGEYSVKQFNPKVLLSPALIAAAWQPCWWRWGFIRLMSSPVR